MTSLLLRCWRRLVYCRHGHEFVLIRGRIDDDGRQPPHWLCIRCLTTTPTIAR
jgi:hypothetical protein